jgi:DNA-directed RNA polymerase specialized sigma54-like protein
MSLKLTTSLSQRLVLTPQLRQRIEMLQMTTLELTDLIQQQILENPVLEEVATQEEVGELAEKILDHLASADPGAAPDEPQRLDATEPEMGTASSNGSGDLEAASAAYVEGEGEGGDSEGQEIAAADLSEDSVGDEIVGEEASRDAFEEIDFGREFQDYLDPGYKTQEIEYKEDAPTFEQFLTRPPSLADHLEWQLHMSPIGEEVCDAPIRLSLIHI